MIHETAVMLLSYAKLAFKEKYRKAKKEKQLLSSCFFYMVTSEGLEPSTH